MSKTLYGWDPTSPDRYDMLINTSRVSIDAAVNAIVDAIQHRNA
jgi:glucuronide carrier protein